MPTINAKFMGSVHAKIEEARSFGDPLFAAWLERVAPILEGQGDTNEAIAGLDVAAPEKARLYAMLNAVLEPAA